MYHATEQSQENDSVCFHLLQHHYWSKCKHIITAEQSLYAVLRQASQPPLPVT